MGREVEKVGEGIKLVKQAEHVGDVIKGSSEGEKTYQTYTKTNEITGEIYSGRTSGTGSPYENIAKRDADHHMNKEGFGPAQLDKSSANKNAIRGREQELIENHGGAKSQGGTSGNKINDISDKNPNKPKYVNANKMERW